MGNKIKMMVVAEDMVRFYTSSKDEVEAIRTKVEKFNRNVRFDVNEDMTCDILADARTLLIFMMNLHNMGFELQKIKACAFIFFTVAFALAR